MTIQKLTLRQHEKLQAMFDREYDRLRKLPVPSDGSALFGIMLDDELSELTTLKALILDLPHDNSHDDNPDDFISRLSDFIVRLVSSDRG